ncbi:phosphopantetheine-binding protein [Erwiniaceae bacterium BAC15a-03b]|uniref:Phosphopantetheine-binding protein n=1 Tax=Winslowiella arboricola TaxID=2978220 RepID=A0A9J6PPX0_9GAMM|nr:phosphopantetheine-binding protein [Winslowiella arboricola]MCU5773754.1 phosphopantetheine-binding protein [Winslowiella arboricola]MCU5777664.1 phosphopantetheine-binding protein [Winslowiella arboricola]
MDTDAGVDQRELRERIRQIIARCAALDSAAIDDSSWLAIDLYIDSLILTEIVYETEAAFAISIHESEMTGINQVADYYLLVANKLARR